MDIQKIIDKKIVDKVIELYEKVAIMQITPSHARIQFINILESSLTKAVESERKRVLEMIANDQGWEESRDIYAKKLGLPLKYSKLKSNH